MSTFTFNFSSPNKEPQKDENPTSRSPMDKKRVCWWTVVPNFLHSVLYTMPKKIILSFVKIIWGVLNWPWLKQFLCYSAISFAFFLVNYVIVLYKYPMVEEGNTQQPRVRLTIDKYLRELDYPTVKEKARSLKDEYENNLKIIKKVRNEIQKHKRRGWLLASVEVRVNDALGEIEKENQMLCEHFRRIHNFAEEEYVKRKDDEYRIREEMNEHLRGVEKDKLLREVESFMEKREIKY